MITSWRPAIGDRVQVRLSPECRHPRREVTTGKIERYGHYPEEHGAVGQVIPFPARAKPANQHDIAVWFDQAIAIQTEPQQWEIMSGGAYFIGELEPIDQENQ